MASDFLLFRLFGPFASWGDVAVGEFRPSVAHPTKSAVLGLVGGALGVRREDREGQAYLRSGYGFGVRLDDPGVLVTDYHTVETPHARIVDQRSKKGDVATTRRDELCHAGDATKTNLSRREYRMDAKAVAALWRMAGSDAPWSLQQIAAALRSPQFTPYLGRKSCSPGLPFAPVIVEAEHPVEALRQARFDVDAMLGAGWTRPSRVQFRWEEHNREEASVRIAGYRIERRRDDPMSRTEWLFGEREEFVASEAVPHDDKESSNVSKSD